MVAVFSTSGRGEQGREHSGWAGGGPGVGEGWPAGVSLSTRVQMAGAGSACVFEGGRQVTCLQLADVLQVVDVEEDRDARHVKQHLVRVRVRVRVLG